MKKLTFFLFVFVLAGCSSKREISLGSPPAEFSDSVVLDKKKEDRTNQTWKRSGENPHNATLFIGDKDQLPMKGAQFAVKIDGFRARILADYFFFSDEKQIREGTFKMKLPQGASPYYFAFGETVALDKSKSIGELPFTRKNQIDLSPEGIEELRSESWSQPKIARVVEKEKAAFAYGQTVRRRVDPALVEWAGADIFNTRVFPLAPGKLHRIVIGYEVNLTALGNDWVYDFALPEVKESLVIDFDIADEVGLDAQIPAGISADHEEGRTSFRLVSPELENIKIRYQDVPNVGITENIASGESYFAATVSPQLPATSNPDISDQAVIALDISLSANPDKFNVWLKLTEALLLNNSSSIKQFNVLLFNIEAFWWEKGMVENTPGNVAKFLLYASKLSLEGASDLNFALKQIANTSFTQHSGDNIFLLSDGADTWGENDIYQMATNIRENDQLFAFNTGMSGTSIENLSHLTKHSGGALFTVNGEGELDKVSVAFQSAPWKIDQVAIDGGNDLLIEGMPEYLYEGQKLFLAGRGKLTANSVVKVNLSQNQVKRTLNIPLDHLLQSDLAERAYGQLATRLLESFDFITEQKSIAYARHFKVPGKTCSLLMLETDEDYKNYDIHQTEDAYLVKSIMVNQILSEVEANIEKILGSAKVKFQQWMKKLATIDGVNFVPSPALDLFIEKIPETGFLVNTQPLTCKIRFNDETNQAFQDSLRNSTLDYDLLTETAQQRLENYGPHDALKTLSSLIEKNPGNAVMTRDVAFSAMEWNLNGHAYFLLRRVIESRPFEPQTYHAVGQALAQMENYPLAIVYYEIAMNGKWETRFGEIRRIVALDYLNVLKQIKTNDQNLNAYINSRVETLKSEFKEESADLMMVISWNTDQTDIDLHVIEPTGEKCFYKNRKTKIGGYMTEDVTQGYGPEMYILSDAKSGTYQVRVKYFSSNRNRTSTRTKVYATVYQDWGTENESVIHKVLTLKDNKELHDILAVEWPNIHQ